VNKREIKIVTLLNFMVDAGRRFICMYNQTALIGTQKWLSGLEIQIRNATFQALNQRKIMRLCKFKFRRGYKGRLKLVEDESSIAPLSTCLNFELLASKDEDNGKSLWVFWRDFEYGHALHE
jgi:hypothetical protein